MNVSTSSYRPSPIAPFSAAPAAEEPADRALLGGEPRTPLTHKLVAGAVAGGVAWNVSNLASQVASLPGVTAKVAAAALVAGSALAGWAAADIGSGIFHWAVDNYPTRNTPVLGELAEKFQIHHHERHSVLERSTLSNLAQVGTFTALPILALGLFSPHYAVTAGVTSMLLGTTLGQVSHRWTHHPQAPRLARTLQKARVLQSRSDHARHHAMPWDDYYCIVNGMWNQTLSRANFWRKLEKQVFQLTGREPKSWRDPGVKALALGQVTQEEFQANRKVDRAVFRQAAQSDYRDYKARQLST